MNAVQRITPVVLVGGGGSRLWPLSRPGTPKQFANLVGTHSMLADTLARIMPDACDVESVTFSPPVLVGAARQSRSLQKELAEAEITRFMLILEPVARNTAPAIAAAALTVQRSAPNALVLVLPADHHIRNVPALHAALADGVPPALDGAIVTFGVVPDTPETGYGYIRRGDPLDEGKTAFKVAEFVEKPTSEKAKAYIKAGTYSWNAGIFLARSDQLISALEEHAGDTLEAVRDAIDTASYGGQTMSLGQSAFRRASADSIDFAVMERVKDAVVVPVDMGWSDVGSWAALFAAAHESDDEGVSRGRVISLDAEGSYLRSDEGLVAVIGVKDVAVVRDRDTVLVTPLDRAQDVKTVAERVLSLSPLPHAEGGAETGKPSKLALAAGRYCRWLRDEVVPRWLSAGWDRDRGGFREHLGLDGEIVTEEARRVRVQARQIFSFSLIHLLGWSDKALDVAVEGFDYLTRHAWAPTGGWCHLISPSGSIIDPMRDAYDHAFVAFAIAWYYRASGDRAALLWADRTNDYLDAVLVDPAHGGYFESVPGAEARRANPHMHLLEASLSLFDATQDFAYLDRADAMVELFSDHFFDPETGSVIEHFTQEWEPLDGPERGEREPGHAFEWAWLLGQHARRLGLDHAGEARRLVEFGTRHGVSRSTGLVWDTVTPAGKPAQRTHRIWPQTEAARALAVGYGGEETAAGDAAADRITALLSHHIGPATSGLWIDRVDDTGKPIADIAPASTLYHLLTLAWELAPYTEVRAGDG